jgi:hypothetical protein
MTKVAGTFAQWPSATTRRIVPHAQMQISAATERWRAPGRDLAIKATGVLPMKSNRSASDDYHITIWN